MTFGKRLKQARNKKQLTQNQVAVVLGINYTTISKYENDKSQPDNDILQRISSLYDVSLDWLLTGEVSNGKNKSNLICLDGEQDELTAEEAKYLKDSLEMFRLLNAKRRKDNANI
jgi:transcriptional regulator with XRE-family HTH domain